MGKIFSSSVIVDLVENKRPTENLVSWAGTCKMFAYMLLVLGIIAGILTFSEAGVFIIISAIAGCISLIVTSHIMVNLAIIAEAASITVLENKITDEELSKRAETKKAEYTDVGSWKAR